MSEKLASIGASLLLGLFVVLTAVEVIGAIWAVASHQQALREKERAGPPPAEVAEAADTRPYISLQAIGPGSAEYNDYAAVEPAQERGGGAAEATGGTAGTEAETVTRDSGGGASGGNGAAFDTYKNEAQQKTEARYVLNTSTMKVHHPGCGSVAKIKPENYETSNLSIAELEARGFSRCKQNDEAMWKWE